MKVLFLAENKENYKNGYYHQDYLSVVKENHDVTCYGRWHDGYDPEDPLEAVFSKTGGQPELIVLGTSWEWDEHPEVFDSHPAIRLDRTDIPKVMFLNKEYKKLDQKLAYIAEGGIDLVFSAIPSIVQNAPEGRAAFVHLPYAVNTDLFTDWGRPKNIDFAFTGNLHIDYTDLRLRVRNELETPDYQALKFYWAEWGSQGTPHGEPYAQMINQCKLFFSTPSALDIIGPRFYEVMACRTLLFCPESKGYEGLFEPGVHCLTFNPDLSDFRDKLFRALENEAEREAIAARGYEHVRAHHSISARAEDFERALSEVLCLRK